MDFVDETPVLSELKDSALNYLGQKTGVDVNKIYDTTHKIVDAIPDVQTQTQEMYDPYGYNNQSYNYYGNTYGNQYSQYPQYSNYSTPSYNYSSNQYTIPTPTHTYDSSSFTSAMNNTYNQMQKQAEPEQKKQVSSNFDLFGKGMKSCGMDMKTYLNSLTGNKRDTIMKNIPKMLVMAANAKGGFSIDKSFKPLLEKFGHHSLIVPKGVTEFVKKMGVALPKISAIPSFAIANAKDKMKAIANANANKTSSSAGSNDLRVNTAKSSNQLSSTNNKSTNAIKPNSTGRLNLGRGNEVGGKKNRYADILAKLSKK